MITVIKKIIVKEKEGKRQGKKKSFHLNKTDVIFTVNTSKEV